MQRRTFITAASSFALAAPNIGATKVRNVQQLPPDPPREFRGFWVATVGNIDFPSRQGLGVKQLQGELRAIVRRAVEMHCNAIVFQVRPACDALYESKLEPWSEYLTGSQGKNPGLDPLAYLITECRKAGIDVHAWFNPFRARPAVSKGKAHPQHISRTNPELVRTYGTMQWLDPGDPRVRQHSLDVIADVVERYDVDGVHIDDYFYPYRESDKASGKDVPFPDDATYAAYRKGGGQLQRDDWRRSNVDVFVEAMYRRVHSIKSTCLVGISPFGIWRPGFPAQIKGFDAYDQIYADSRKWLQEGWVDYFTPQLYWPIDRKPQSFPVLLNWWLGQNSHARHIWPGLYTGKYDASEIEFQIKTARGMDGASGHIHFSTKSLLKGDVRRGRGHAAHLRSRVYNAPAIVPASPWKSLSMQPVDIVKEFVITDGNLVWQNLSGTSRSIYLQFEVDRDWRAAMIGPKSKGWRLPDGVSEVWVRVVSECGVVTEPVLIAMSS
jgi:uncharacterized lipoprotein YddW (UPF0748 family)